MSPNPKSWIKPDGKGWLVGASNGEYRGPVARVWADREWLHVMTDDHEGAAMVDLASLDNLILALQRLRRAARKS